MKCVDILRYVILEHDDVVASQRWGKIAVADGGEFELRANRRSQWRRVAVARAHTEARSSHRDVNRTPTPIAALIGGRVRHQVLVLHIRGDGGVRVDEPAVV